MGFLQRPQFADQGIEVGVADLRFVELVVAAVVVLDLLPQLRDTAQIVVSHPLHSPRRRAPRRGWRRGLSTLRTRTPTRGAQPSCTSLLPADPRVGLQPCSLFSLPNP